MRHFSPSIIVAIGLLACGGRSDSGLYGQTPYEEDSTVVVGDTYGPRETSTPDGEDCIDVAGGCVRPQDVCGESGTADVIVDGDGDVLDVVCYRQDVAVTNVPIDEVDTVDAGNNTVLVLDGNADGDDVAGDVVLSGNNAIVYGNGPDTSVIGGSLDIQKNNAIVRGVRIRGDVVIDKNNTHLLFCVIEGDLTVLHNNTTIAECDVHGTVTIGLNNTVLVSNRFAGIDSIAAMNAQCSNNWRFDDLNEDGIVDEDEVGAPVTCLP